KLDGVKAVEGFLSHQNIDLPVRNDSTHHREMITGLPLVKNRGVPGGSVGPHPSRKEVKASFVHKNQGTALTASLAFQVWPAYRSPTIDFLLVALDSPLDRKLGRPAQILEKTRDVTPVVRNTELLGDYLGHAGAGPDLAAKAVGLRPIRQEVRD